MVFQLSLVCHTSCGKLKQNRYEQLSVPGVSYNWMQLAWPHFYQTRSVWSKDQGSNENHSPVHNFAPTVTKCCVMWEGQALPQDTKFGNCRDKIVDRRAFLSWSLILGLAIFNKQWALSDRNDIYHDRIQIVNIQLVSIVSCCYRAWRAP